MSNFLDRAGRWFLDSGIQESEGGVARYRRTDTRQNLPISTEITGYAVSTLVFLHARTGDAAYLDRALAAARYLTRCGWHPAQQALPFETAAPGNRLTYFFDCGIIVRGLLTAYGASGEAEFLDVAAACGRAMARDFRASGCIHPILRLPDKRPLPCDHQWSRSSGCYQLKAAMAWWDLSTETGEQIFHDCYREALDYSLRTHDTFLPGDPDSNRVMDRLHAYSYFLEGMLPAASEAACQAALATGIDRVACYLREIGPTFERSDVYAQLLRVRLCADWAGAVPLDRQAAEFEAERLAGFQCADADAQVAGGFWFGRKGGGMLPFINPVSAGFALQALAVWEDWQAGRPPLHRRALI
jgi:hypothetical protein